MSKKLKPSTRKVKSAAPLAARPSPTVRNRHNVMFSEESHARGRELAQQDHRSFGGEMEYLIDKEWRARNAQAA